MSDTEPFDELTGAQRVLSLLRRRRQRLSEQAAVEGFQARPGVLIEIEEVSAEISRHEAEVARLQTEKAVDRFSLAEAEYREMLAKVWGTERGEPTVAGAAALEVQRLRLGLSPERAAELAGEIRAKLAIETLDTITPTQFARGHMWNMREPSKVLARAVRLDMIVTAQIIATRTVSQYPSTATEPQVIQLRYNGKNLIEFNNVWEDSEEQNLFYIFLARLAQELEERGVKVEKLEREGSELSE